MESTPVLTLRGVTLLEMIVVLAIIVLITAVVLTGQSNFDKSIRLTDTAYTVALTVRQAQTYGLSSRVFRSTNNSGYGVHFDIATPTTYLMFADLKKTVYSVPSYCPMGTVGTPDEKPGNCQYDPGTSEVAQTYNFNRGFSVTNICGHDTSSVLRCTSTSYLTGVDVTYLRPNTDSIITGLRSQGNIQLTDAQITLSEPGGTSRLVCITQVGEISVAASACP